MTDESIVALTIFTYVSIEIYLMIDLYKRIYIKIGIVTNTSIEPVIRKILGFAFVRGYISFGQYRSPDLIINEIHNTVKIAIISTTIISDRFINLGNLISKSLIFR